MKQPYNWDYTIRVKTKEGTFEYEKETLDNLDLLLKQHKDYEELRATKNTIRCDKCHIELNQVYFQQNHFRTYKLCKNCNDRYLQYMENINKLTKRRNSDGRTIKKNN